jgi:hypothetical protein
MDPALLLVTFSRHLREFPSVIPVVSVLTNGPGMECIFRERACTVRVPLFSR